MVGRWSPWANLAYANFGQVKVVKFCNCAFLWGCWCLVFVLSHTSLWKTTNTHPSNQRFGWAEADGSQQQTTSNNSSDNNNKSFHTATKDPPTWPKGTYDDTAGPWGARTYISADRSRRNPRGLITARVPASWQPAAGVTLRETLARLGPVSVAALKALFFLVSSSHIWNHDNNESTLLHISPSRRRRRRRRRSTRNPLQDPSKNSMG